MIIKSKLKNSFPLDLSDTYVVADFDRTITNGNSKTSWSILANNNLIGDSYVQERQALFDKYRPIEINETLSFDFRMQMMKEWFEKHIELLIKYKVSEETFKIAGSDLNSMELRSGAKDFITFLHYNNVPLIIFSAGVGNFIETFLRCNNCFLDNVHIISNEFIFENKIVCGIKGDIIHSLNKNEASIPEDIISKVQGRNNVVLLGDQPSDLNMVNKKKHNFVTTIGFVADDSHDKLNLLSNCFDIVCEENEDYYCIQKLIFGA